MKKIVLTVMTLLSLTMAHAADENLNAVEGIEAYRMEINNKRLAHALDLTSDQLDAVNDVHKEFSANLLSVAAANVEARPAMLKNTIEIDLRYMRMILSAKQYRKYLVLLNATLNNRGLNK